MDISKYILTMGLKGLTRDRPMLRREAMKEHRQDVRDKAIKSRRKLSESLNISTASPAASSTINTVTNKPSRLELLKQWKEKRDKALQELKAKSKPVFKVPCSKGFDPINKIYSETKRKKVAKPPSTKEDLPQTLVGKNHKFKPPGNIKPIEFSKATTQSNVNSEKPKIVTKKLNFNSKPVEKTNQGKHYNTRSTAVKQNSKVVDKPSHVTKPNPTVVKSKSSKVKTSENDVVSDAVDSKKQGKKETKKVTTKKAKKIEIKQEIEQKPEVLLEVENLTKSPKHNIKETPEVIIETVEAPTDSRNMETPERKKSTEELHLGYISPYVTISRGKDSARKEYKNRSSLGGFSAKSPETTGSKAAAAYFNKLLDEEIIRIQLMCNQWEKYKDENNPPEEACDMINTAIGQSNLLISKRMQQFRGLIKSCEFENSDPIVTAKDLHGFWDVLLTQVQNLNLRFENLDKLCADGWEEIIPIKKKVVPKKKKRPIKKSGTASSEIRDAINAARKAAKENANPKNSLCVKNFDGGFFSVTSPRKDFTVSKASSKNTPSRKSILQNVLIENNKRTNISSPGLAMLNASLVSKSVNYLCTTPGKSILKPGTSKSTAKKSKAVLFVEDVEEQTQLSDSNFPDEKSDRRLTKTKLFD